MPAFASFVLNENKSESTVLLVEDDVMMAQGLTETFKYYGFLTTHCADWQSTVVVLRDRTFDVVVLDQRLGRVDTLARLPELRGLTDAPIIFLTGNQLEADRIVGLEMGADDFLVKPISGREIIARVRAHLRRSANRPAPAPDAGPQGWRIAATDRRLYGPDGATVPLTAAEFTLLEYLAKAPGQPCDRETLTRQVLNRPYRVEDRSIDNLVYQLRQKIGQAGGGEVIVAMRSKGYAFTGFRQADAA